MENIINNNALLREIRRIVKEEIKKAKVERDLDSMWKYLNKINDELKIIKGK